MAACTVSFCVLASETRVITLTTIQLVNDLEQGFLEDTLVAGVQAGSGWHSWIILIHKTVFVSGRTLDAGFGVIDLALIKTVVATLVALDTATLCSVTIGSVLHVALILTLTLSTDIGHKVGQVVERINRGSRVVLPAGSAISSVTSDTLSARPVASQNRRHHILSLVLQPQAVLVGVGVEVEAGVGSCSVVFGVVDVHQHDGDVVEVRRCVGKDIGDPYYAELGVCGVQFFKRASRVKQLVGGHKALCCRTVLQSNMVRKNQFD